jgi:BTB/POZ domain-containing protein KCTD9
MKQKLMKYLDGVFSAYEDVPEARELKEELLNNLQDRMIDFKDQGYDEETAYNMTIDSIGDIKEIIESVSIKTKEFKEIGVKDISNLNLKDSDLKGVIVYDGKFNANNLRGSDFSGSDLTNSIFKHSDLRDVIFDGANLTGVEFNGVDLKKSSFSGCILDNTEFKASDLGGICFDNQTFIGTIFNKSSLKGTTFKNAVFRNISIKHSDFSKAIFDGATMDKLTYAVLKSGKANLTNVTVI